MERLFERNIGKICFADQSALLSPLNHFIWLEQMDRTLLQEEDLVYNRYLMGKQNHSPKLRI